MSRSCFHCDLANMIHPRTTPQLTMHVRGPVKSRWLVQYSHPKFPRPRRDQCLRGPACGHRVLSAAPSSSTPFLPRPLSLSVPHCAALRSMLSGVVTRVRRGRPVPMLSPPYDAQILNFLSVSLSWVLSIALGASHCMDLHPKHPWSYSFGSAKACNCPLQPPMVRASSVHFVGRVSF